MTPDHRRRSSPSRWCCSRCSCRSPSSRAFPAAVPPIRGHHQRRHADLRPQRADAVAGALRAVAAPRRRRAAASWAACCAASIECATAMPWSCGGWCASPCSSLVLIAVVRGRHRRLCRAMTPDELPAGGGPGRVLPQRAAARRRLGGAHQRDRRGRSRTVLRSMPQVQDTFAVIGFSLLDSANESNTAFMVAEAQAVRGPQPAPPIRRRR